jgi:hypothetical protein
MWERKRDRTRRAIIDAAAELFAERGYAKTMVGISPRHSFRTSPRAREAFSCSAR